MLRRALTAVVLALVLGVATSCAPPAPIPGPGPGPTPGPIPTPGPGPDPGPLPPGSIEAFDRNGPYAVTSYVGSGQGFSTGTVYYPTNAPGPVGALVVLPGFTENQSAISWLGERVASHGFVVMTIDTQTPGDFPPARAQQIIAARTWLVNEASGRLGGILDPSRYSYSGHSMGGGGTLLAGLDDPGVSALLPLAPWNTSPDFSSLQKPTLVVACQNDAIASTAVHAEPMYASLSGTKAYLEMAGANHFCTNTGQVANRLIGRYMITFLKAYMDGDSNYTAFLCGAAVSDQEISEYSTTIC